MYHKRKARTISRLFVCVKYIVIHAVYGIDKMQISGPHGRCYKCNWNYGR